MRRILIFITTISILPVISLIIGTIFYKKEASTLISFAMKNQEERSACLTDPQCWKDIDLLCKKDSSISRVFCSLSDRLKRINNFDQGLIASPTKNTVITYKIVDKPPNPDQADQPPESLPSSYAKNILSKIKKKLLPGKDPKTGIKISKINNGLRITELKSSSLWSDVGFKLGDHIVTINGQAPKSADFLFTLPEKKNKPHSVWVKRENKKNHLIFSF